MNNCLKCPLAETRLRNNLNAVPGCGLKTAPLMLVAEAPIRMESLQGGPMAGLYGEVLRRVLASANIDSSLIWKDNLVKCVPLNDKGKLRSAYVEEEIKKCIPYLETTISEIKPKLIIALGDDSLKFLSGNRKINIKRNHGQLYKSEKYNCYLMGTFHPKVILAEYEYIKYMIQDFQKAKQFLETGESTISSTNYVFANDKQKLSSVLDQLSKQVAFSFDVETTGLNFLTDKVLCIGFSWAENSGAVIPLCNEKGDPFWDDVTAGDIKHALDNVFANESLKIAYNGSFDVLFLKRLGFNINNFSFDPMLAHHLLDENAQGMRSLKQLALLYTDMGNYDSALDEYKVANKIPKNSGMLGIPPELLATYCAADVDCTFRLYNKFMKKLEDEKLLNLFNKLTMPLCNVLIDTKYRGIKVDLNYMMLLRQKLEKQKQELEVDLHALNGGPFNIASTPQLRDFLYKKLNLIPITDKRTGYDKLTSSGEVSTNIEVLKELVKQDKAVNILIDYRKITKYLGTFINGLEYDQDARVHTNYNIAGTTSGRLSSSDPNCLSMDTEILTASGFKKYHDLKDSDKIACFDCITGTIKWESLTKRYISQFKEREMISIKNTHIDMCMTTSHRCIFKSRKGNKISVVPAKSFLKDSTTLHGARWESESRAFSSIHFLKLLIATQADAELRADSDVIRFRFFKKRKYLRLLSILKNLPYKYTATHKYDKIHDKITYEIKFSKVSDIKHFLGIDKTFSTNLLTMSSYEREIFISELGYWDGCRRDGATINYSSCNEKNVDIVQALLSLTGFRGHKHTYFSKFSTKPNYQLDITKVDHSSTANCKVVTYTLPCKVWCVEVPTGAFIARRGSDTFITGNCQNIPRDKTIKHLFCAKDGYSLVQCDLSAAEFRAWGHYSQDQKMIADIKADFDIHRYTASKVFNLPEDQITKKQRTAAKRVVFGLMYGQGVEATAEQNGLSIPQARKVISTFFGKYTRAKSWLDYIVIQAKQTKCLTNVFGRKRRFLGFDSPNKEVIALCERQAKNFLMQSTVADITNWAGVRLFSLLRQYDSYLVLTVHDSLIYEVPDAHVETVKEIIRKEVTRPIKGYTVPIGIDLKIGKHWDDGDD